jgi:hypothetical protein
MSSQPKSSTPDLLWARFRAHTSLPEWERFEHLAAKLLQQMYPGDWVPTPRTHDGSRDFYLRIDGVEYWAECKAYSSNLSMHIISPTLIMALLENVGKVIFFSKSPFNSGAREIIARYKVLVDKDILLYDGSTLVALINQYPAIASEFFGDSLVLTPFAEPIYSSATILRDVYLSQERPSSSSSNHFALSIFDVFRIDVLLKNNDALNSAEARVTLNLKGDQYCVLGDSGGEVRASIPPASLHLVHFYLKALKPGKRVPLPIIYISSDTHNFSEHHSLGTVDVTKLFHLPLVGEQFRRIVEDLPNTLKHRNQPVFFTIAGRSGVGKSRLLREVAQIGFAQGFLVQYFESEFVADPSASNLIRQFLANVNELPLFGDAMTEGQYRDLQEQERLGRSEASMIRSVLRILYDRTFNVVAHMDEVLEAVLFSITRKRVMLLIDNVQNRSDTFGRFLRQLIATLEDTNITFVLGLGFNRDLLLSDSEAAILLAQQATSSRSIDSRRYFHEVREFTRQDAAEFLDLALSGDLFSEGGISEYQRTIDLFLSRVQPRPLNLWQSLLYLTDTGVLAVAEESIYVADPVGFRAGLLVIPENLQELLSKRWSIAQANSSRYGMQPEQIDGAVRKLYFLGSADHVILQKFNVSAREIDYLVQSGFLIKRPSGVVEFFHFQLFQFFRSQNQRISRGAAAELRGLFIRYRYSRPRFEQFLILSHYAEKISSRGLSFCAQEFIQRGVTPEYGLEFCEILKANLLSRGNSKGVLAQKRVAALNLIAQYVHHQSFEKGVATFEEIFTKLLHNWKVGVKHSEEYFEYLREMANAYLGVSNNSKALEVLGFALAHFDEFSFEGFRERNLALCRLLDRRATVYRSLGLISEAVRDSTTSIALAKEHGHDRLLMKCYFQAGNIHRENQGSRELVWRYWSAGLEVYRQLRHAGKVAVDPRAAYIQSLMLLSEHRFPEAVAVITPAIAHAQANSNPYWGIRLLLLDACARLMEGKADRESRLALRRTLISARDWWNIAGAERLGWTISYLEAKEGMLQGRISDACAKFRLTLKNLGGHLDRSSATMTRKVGIYVDIAISMRDLGLSLEAYDLQVTPSSLREEIRTIFLASHTRYSHIREEHFREALLSTSDTAYLCF